MKKSIFILVGLATWLALGAAGTAAAQVNVVVNPNFAGDLSGWVLGPNGSFNSADCCGDATPGSAAGATGDFNNLKTAVTQCMAYDQTVHAQFGFGGQISVTDATGVGVASRATITVQFFNAAACSGSAVGQFTVGLAPVLATTPFTLFALTGQTTPATALSAQISIFVQRGSAFTNSIDANFDHIFLGENLTTPVSLQHFNAE